MKRYHAAAAYYIITALFLCCSTDTAIEGHHKSHEIVVSAGESDHPCFLQKDQTVCCNLSDAFKLLRSHGSNNTKVTIKGTTNLEGNISLPNMVNISLIGAEPNAKITCHSNGSIIFLSIINLSIRNLTIIGCGSESTDYTFVSKHEQITAVLMIIKCVHVEISNLKVMNSSSAALSISNTTGNVLIENSNFSVNGRGAAKEGWLSETVNIINGGGLLIVIDNTTNRWINFTLNNCLFEKNTKRLVSPKSMNYGSGHGGGLEVIVHNTKTPQKLINIHKCIFVNNSAESGGGAMIKVYNSRNVSVFITDCRFISNVASNAVVSNGGGLHITLLGNCDTCTNNSINIIKSNFTENHAYFGGGLSIDCGRTKIRLDNQVNVCSCRWLRNIATSGAAVDISLHFTNQLFAKFEMIEPVFTDCHFLSNTIYYQTKKESFQIGYAVFSVIETDVTFKSSVYFIGNIGSALSGTMCTLHFTSCNAFFINNTRSINGGAVKLKSATMALYPHTHINFTNNTASKQGGAVYSFITDDHMLFSPDFCPFTFIDNCTPPNDKCHIDVIFINNVPNSVYVPSLLPCRIAYSPNSDNLIDANQVFTDRRFKFLENSNSTFHIFTAPSSVHPKLGHIELYAGEPQQMNFTLKDELNHNIPSQLTIFEGAIQDLSSSDIQLESVYIYNYTLTVLGPNIETTSMLHFQTIEKPLLTVTMNVTIKPCPPGYHHIRLNNDTEIGQCECAESSFYGVVKCDRSTFGSSIKRGVWCGKVKGTFVTSPCHWFCKFFPGKMVTPIPADLTRNKNFQCANNREGVICGSCKNNYTTYYHDDRFYCRHASKECNWGWLIFIASEIIPMTLLFAAITITSFNVTSGYVQGFLLYCHIFCSLTGSGSISKPSRVYKMYWNFVHLLYFPLNMKFFYFKGLSYCISPDISSLGVVSIFYIKGIYSVILIIIVVGFMKCFAIRCHGCNRWLRFTTAKNSTLIGMSALLVLSYTSAVETSLIILQPAPLYTENYEVLDVRAALHGDCMYFRDKHFKYAIFASTVFILMLVPAIMLFTYPFVLYLLSVCNINADQSWIGFLMTKGFMYNQLKPFYDLFYGSFKDKHRYFAGLYFIYRALIQLSYYIPNYTESSFIMETLLITFLVLHAIVQPYQKRCHNILDACLLSTLVIVNGVNCVDMVVIYNSVHRHFWKPIIAAYCQMILAVSPMCIVLGFVSWRYILSKMWRRIKQLKLKYQYFQLIESTSNHLEYGRHVSLQDHSD